jgi:hypothetical protein
MSKNPEILDTLIKQFNELQESLFLFSTLRAEKSEEIKDYHLMRVRLGCRNLISTMEGLKLITPQPGNSLPVQSVSQKPDTDAAYKTAVDKAKKVVNMLKADAPDQDVGEAIHKFFVTPYGKNKKWMPSRAQLTLKGGMGKASSRCLVRIHNNSLRVLKGFVLGVGDKKRLLELWPKCRVLKYKTFLGFCNKLPIKVTYGINREGLGYVSGFTAGISLGSYHKNDPNYKEGDKAGFSNEELLSLFYYCKGS